MKVNKNIWVGKSKPYNKNSLHFPNGINSDVDSGGVKYYKGTLGVWAEVLASLPIFMPMLPSGGYWSLMSPVAAFSIGENGLGLFDDGTTILKVYPGKADTRDSAIFEQFPFLSFEQYVEYIKTQGAEIGSNEEYTEITEEEFYELFELIKTQNE